MKRFTTRRALSAVMATGMLAYGGVVILTPAIASAAPLAASCSTTVPNGSSGWCGLTGGTAANSALYGGQLTLTGDGQMLTIESQVNSSGVAPPSSWACLIVSTTATTDLAGAACATAGGTLVTWSGASTVLNLSVAGY